LAKRLLSGRSSSDDSEKMFISELKKEFGYQFTSKLEGMFKDIKLSKDLNIEWKSFLKDSSKKIDYDMTCQILTNGCWPIVTNTRLELPIFLSSSCDIFKDFYLQKYSGRKLSWLFNMGTADIKANGYDKAYELNVSTYQLGILLHFNDTNELSFSEISELTKIPLNDLKKNLLALCLSTDKLSKNSKVLTKTKNDKKELDENTIFRPNEDFKSKLIKVKILPVVMKESNEALQETQEKINEERKWVLDSVIVRIMKMRKKIEHQKLIIECTEQLQNRFMPSPDLIKKRIESLIDREYIERSEYNRKIYNYVA
jgi:cullin 3